MNLQLFGHKKGDAIEWGRQVTEETARVRNYTNRKGINGIEQDGKIIARDNNRVYVEPVNKKPLSQIEAETKYQIKKEKEEVVLRLMLLIQRLNGQRILDIELKSWQ
ncbi:hypothetical protein [Clostridium sp. UBA6640]|uniref:hypothetical protein n=1 Tax=Clostridium sp. UBA6640 TaxID=1946370 RepID=UPI0025BC990A|nr:hypothetical protein [Clostridium sp. UBA6640]